MLTVYGEGGKKLEGQHGRLGVGPAGNIRCLFGRSSTFRITETSFVRVAVLITCIKCFHGLPRITDHLSVNCIGANSTANAL
jgi:hypothetical protein